MAITQQQLDALEAAIADPTEELRFQDRSVRRRGISDLVTAHQYASKVKEDSAAAAAGRPKVRQILLYGGGGE